MLRVDTYRDDWDGKDEGIETDESATKDGQERPSEGKCGHVGTAPAGGVHQLKTLAALDLPVLADTNARPPRPRTMKKLFGRDKAKITRVTPASRDVHTDLGSGNSSEVAPFTHPIARPV